MLIALTNDDQLAISMRLKYGMSLLLYPFKSFSFFHFFFFCIEGLSRTTESKKTKHDVFVKNLFFDQFFKI